MGSKPRSSQVLRCSIVIRAYNEERHIGRLLAGILRQTVRQVEIILVDSGSTDATLAIASRYPVLISRIEPGGFTFGRSLNLGCGRAKADLIVIASAHVFPVYPDWLGRAPPPLRRAATTRKNVPRPLCLSSGTPFVQQRQRRDPARVVGASAVR